MLVFPTEPSRDKAEVITHIRDLWYHRDDGEVHAVHQSLLQAAAAAETGNYGVGTVIVDKQGRIVASGQNERRLENEWSHVGHAEVIAIRNGRRQGRWRTLSHGELRIVTNIEACFMCTGAILNEHIGTIVCGAPDIGGGFALKCQEDLTKLEPDWQAIWKRNGTMARLANVPPEISQLSWEIFLATRHELHQKLHKTY